MSTVSVAPSQQRADRRQQRHPPPLLPFGVVRQQTEPSPERSLVSNHRHTQHFRMGGSQFKALRGVRVPLLHWGGAVSATKKIVVFFYKMARLVHSDTF